MKQFNLEEYLKNPSRKVVTRDGRKVRIICTDRKGATPIIALVDVGLPDREELGFAFYPDGKSCENYESDADLFFAPEKHEGWINLYRLCSTGVKYPGCELFNTKKEAKQGLARKDNGYIATIKIEWEE